MIDPAVFRSLVIVPTLTRLNLDSQVARELLLGTALQESGLNHLVQEGGGPARGLFQVEPATHADVWANYLHYRPELLQAVLALTAPWPDRDAQLATNLVYEAAIARLVYLRAPEPLPATPDPDLLGAYWKAHYNTAGGAGTVTQFADTYRHFAGTPG
jgi:hypothetical protein